MSATVELTRRAAPPPLACSLCGTMRRALRISKDETATYRYPPDHVHHGNAYTWRIGANGAWRG